MSHFSHGQIIPQIDTEIAEKGYFWMKMNSSFAPLIFKGYNSDAGPEIMFKAKPFLKLKRFTFFRLTQPHCSITY
jgi:hypothetical protein